MKLNLVKLLLPVLCILTSVIVAGQFDNKLDHARSMIPNCEVFLYEVDFKLKEFKS